MPVMHRGHGLAGGGVDGRVRQAIQGAHGGGQPVPQQAGATVNADGVPSLPAGLSGAAIIQRVTIDGYDTQNPDQLEVLKSQVVTMKAARVEAILGILSVEASLSPGEQELLSKLQTRKRILDRLAGGPQPSSSAVKVTQESNMLPSRST